MVSDLFMSKEPEPNYEELMREVSVLYTACKGDWKKAILLSGDDFGSTMYERLLLGTCIKYAIKQGKKVFVVPGKEMEKNLKNKMVEHVFFRP